MNIVTQRKDDSLGLKPNVSYDIFILGDLIENYFYLNFQLNSFNDSHDPYDSYFFIDKEVTVWVKDGVIETIRCVEHCYWLGKNLIGMKYDSFLKEYKVAPASSEKLYVYDGSINRGQNQVVYDFDKEGLLIWVWKNKIKTVLISTYEEE